MCPPLSPPHIFTKIQRLSIGERGSALKQVNFIVRIATMQRKILNKDIMLLSKLDRIRLGNLEK